MTAMLNAINAHRSTLGKSPDVKYSLGRKPAAEVVSMSNFKVVGDHKRDEKGLAKLPAAKLGCDLVRAGNRRST
jgi:hypothetical protein